MHRRSRLQPEALRAVVDCGSCAAWLTSHIDDDSLSLCDCGEYGDGSSPHGDVDDRFGLYIVAGRMYVQRCRPTRLVGEPGAERCDRADRWPILSGSCCRCAVALH